MVNLLSDEIINFLEYPQIPVEGYHKAWIPEDRKAGPVGTIAWYSHQQEYVFTPSFGFSFTNDSLHQIIKFMDDFK